MRESPLPGGAGFALGFATSIVVTVAVVAAGATAHPVLSLAALAVTVAAVSAVSSPPAAAGTATVAWCLHDGFVLGRHGDLVGVTGSATAAVVLPAVALAATLIATTIRARHRYHEAWVPVIPSPRRGVGEETGVLH